MADATWQNLALSRILGVSLDPADPRALPGLISELETERVAGGTSDIAFDESTSRPLLTVAVVERVLVARLLLPANATSDQSLTGYLCDCHAACVTVKANLMAKSKLPPEQLAARVAVLDRTQELVVSYLGLCLSMPDMWVHNEKHLGTGHAEIVDRQLAVAPGELTLLRDLMARYFAEDDGKTGVLNPIFTALAAAMRNQGKLANTTHWMSLFNLLGSALEIENVPSLIAQLPSFCIDNLPPKPFEAATFLGPFLRISGFGFDDPEILNSHFPNASERSQVDRVSGVQSLRLAVQHVHRTVHHHLMGIIKSSPALREQVLRYLGTALKLNAKRNGMHFELDVVGTFGFVHNVTDALVRMCEPFMLPPFPKIHLIDPNYFANPQHKYNISHLTSMNASEQDANEHYTRLREQHAGAPAPNFISDCFYLTLGWLHTGYVRSLTFSANFAKDAAHRAKELERIKTEFDKKYRGTPQQALAEAMLRQYQKQVDADVGNRLALDAHLMDPEELDLVFRFYKLAATWILRVLHAECSGGAPIPVNGVPKLPYPTESTTFKYWPEHFVEDIADFLLFFLRYDRLIIQDSYDAVLELFIVLLMSPDMIKNPYLKSKFAETLFFMTFHEQLKISLSSHPISIAYLVPAIMRLYVDVEITGAHSQFYDKFNIRYNISSIIKAVWDYPVHRAKVKELARSEVFIKFANMTMNDLRYLLDEGLTKLTEIHALKVEMASPEWANQTQQYQQEKQAALETAERHATSYMSLSSQTLDTLSAMSNASPEPFLTPEIIDRLAAMLDFNLKVMVGPKSTELRVENKEKYQFRPRKLLTDLVNIYLNLAEYPEFAKAVARDERSYDKEWFARAAATLARFGGKSEQDLQRLAQFVQRVEEVKATAAQEEEELGEVPDEFLDPIMFTLMEDPVILPTSGNTVDRATITAHLLGEKRDPFNRMELKIEDLVPNTELKAKIDAWKATAKKARS